MISLCEDKERPRFFYKYYSCKDPYSFYNLNSGIIYLSTPEKFNDPHDSVLKFITSQDSSLLTFSEQDFVALVKTKENAKNCRPQKDYREMYNSLRSYIEERSRKHVFACFSSNNKQPLMWGHYATSLSGFCVRFKSNAKCFDNIIQVHYEKQLPSIKDVWSAFLDTSIALNFNVMVNENLSLLTEKCVGTKLDTWIYECEWRLVHEKEETKQNDEFAISYSPDNVSTIIIGSRMEDEHKNLLETIILQKYPNLKSKKLYLLMTE